jgi:hypothetical protein
MSAESQLLENTFGEYTNGDPTEVRTHRGGGLTVGATGSMVRREVFKPGYIYLQTHQDSHALYGKCWPPTLEVPTDHMPIHVKNALESLSPTDFASLVAHEDRGHQAFNESLKASQARWANDSRRIAPRPGPRTERTENLALYHAPRNQPMSVAAHELTRINDGPSIASITTEGGADTGRSISVRDLSVEIPCFVDPPECSPLRELGLRFTLDQEALTRLVTNLRVLEPSVGQKLNSLLANYDEETHATVEKEIGSMIDTEIDTLVKYGVQPQDLEPQILRGPSEEVHSGWRVQGVPGKPRIAATLRE